MIRMSPDTTIEDLSQADLTNFTRQLGQGLTLGGSDEAEAIIRSLVGEQSYNENIDKIRSEIKSFSEKNPEASIGAYISGVIPTLAISVPKLATKLGVTGSSAVLGALEGFLSGENIEGRAKDAAFIGSLSGMLGYSGEKAVKFFAPKVSNFFQKLKNKVTSEVPTDPSRRKALGSIAAAPLAVGALSEVPVEKIVDDLDFIDEVDKLPIKPIEPKIAGSSLFKNMKQEAQFAADMYNAKTGKNLTSKEIVDRDMAEYLYFIEKGDGEPYMLEKATENLKSNPVYQVLDDLGYETDDPDIMKVFKKHMGDADEYSYGSSGGDELTQKLFEEENPDKLFKNEMGNLTFNEDDLIDWIKSKGIQNTKYYKQLVKAGDAD